MIKTNKTNTRIRRSKEESFKLVKDYQKNYYNSSVSSYCNQINVHPGTFYKWQAQFKKELNTKALEPKTKKQTKKVKSDNKDTDFINLNKLSSFKPKKFWVKLFGIKLLRLELDV